uniref:F-box domain-containing protein n=1 Tax=Zea mays TaxID=4577 RepID=A0A804NFT9_MAIZE
MEDHSSWDYLPVEHIRTPVFNSGVVSEASNGGNDFSISLDAVVPDDILERIFTFLPIASMMRATSVCKRWHDIICSRRFLWTHMLPQRPWYFMFTSNKTAAGYAFDPILRKWYDLELPYIDKSSCFISSSCGLVCFMDNDNRNTISVCNPITKHSRRLLEPPGETLPDYSTIAMNVDRLSHKYSIALAKSKQIPEDFVRWDFSVYKYDSSSGSWVTSVREVFVGWRGGDNSVICDGVLYCLIHSTGALGNVNPRHGLIMYDLAGEPSETSLMQTSISVPCSLTCGRLVNLKEKLVLVGGIAKHNRPDIIKGIGIWELHERQWHEVARMPHKFFQGFGEFDDVFACSESSWAKSRFSHVGAGPSIIV